MSENQSIEFKETWKDKYLKWICGFANVSKATATRDLSVLGSIGSTIRSICSVT